MLSELRSYWATADKEEKSFKAMQKLLKSVSPKTGVLLGYEGLTSMIAAQFALLPTTKLQLFLEGKKLLEEAILQDANSVELHFMRFAVQRKTPALLNYQDKIEQDKDFVVRHLPTIEDENLRQFIQNYWKKEGLDV